MKKNTMLIGLTAVLLVLSTGWRAARPSYLVSAQSEPPPAHPFIETLESTPQRGAPEIAGTADPAPLAPEWIPWTKLVFSSLRDGNWEIYLADTNGLNPTRLTYEGATDTHPRLNRGATRIAFASNRTGNFEIFSMNLDGSGLVQLTTSPSDDGFPSWSPDSSQIVFQSYRDGQSEIYVMNADGSAQTRLTWEDEYDGQPAWSPTGDRIAFTSYRGGGYRIWAIEPDGNGLAQLSGQPFSENPNWSPDGSLIAYDSDGNQDGWQELWTMNADGSGQQQVYEAPQYQSDTWARSWSGDGYLVAFTRISWTYYQGQWYWTEADMRAWDSQQPSQSALLLSSSGLDWYPGWETTDILPPNSWMSELPRYSRAAGAPVSWSGEDPGPSGIKGYDVQYHLAGDSTWTDWLALTPQEMDMFTGAPGEQVFFRVRAQDNATNLEGWPPAGQANTTLYSWLLHGQVEDSRSFPIPDALVGLSPAPLSPALTGQSGAYSLYLQATGNHDLDLTRPGYAAYTDTLDMQADLQRTLVLPSLDDRIQNGGFEDAALAGWQASGVVTPTLTMEDPQRGGFSLLLGQPYHFSDLLNISESAYPDEDPAVAVDLGGTAHVVYGEYVDEEMHLMYRSCMPDSTCTPVEYLTTGRYPDMQTGPDNRIHLTYRLDDEILYAWRLPAGGWSQPEVVATISGYQSGSPAIAVDDAGHPHLAWSKERQIYYIYEQDDGNWAPEVMIDGSGTHPSIAVAGGYVHVAWGTAYSVDDIGYRRRPLGGSWEPAESVYSIYSYFYAPGLAVDPEGTVYLAWARHSNDYYTMVALRDASGWSGANELAGFTSTIPQLAVTVDGRILLVEGQYISYQKSDGSWALPRSISGNEPLDVIPEGLDLASNPAKSEIVWVDNLYDTPEKDVSMVRFDIQAEAGGESQAIQSVQIPGNMHRPTLSLISRYFTEDTAGNDWLEITLQDGSNTIELDHLTSTVDWDHHWFDMEPWAGQTVTLTLRLHSTANELFSWANIDEVSLGPWLTPVIQAVSPQAFGAYEPVTITVEGLNFIETPGVRIGQIEADVVTWMDEHTLLAEFHTGAPPGIQRLVVTNTGGQAYSARVLVGEQASLPLILK